jgi:hypothetical protein
MIMAKGQKRSGREPKKPKTSKKKHDMPAYMNAEQVAVQKIIESTATTKH